MVRISDKALLFACFRTSICYTTKRVSNALKSNLLIVGHAPTFATGTLEEVLDVSVAL